MLCRVYGFFLFLFLFFPVLRLLSLLKPKIKKLSYLRRLLAPQHTSPLSPPLPLLFCGRVITPSLLKRLDNITGGSAFRPVSVLKCVVATEDSLSEIDRARPVWIPSVSESFMQGLVHNLSIRWMDGCVGRRSTGWD